MRSWHILYLFSLTKPPLEPQNQIKILGILADYFSCRPTLFIQLGRVGYICSIAIYFIFCMHDRNWMTNCPLMYTLYSNCNVVLLVVTREYWMIYRGPGLSYDLAPPPHFHHPSPSVSSTGDKKGRLRKRDTLLTGDTREGVGEETNQQTARKPGPL